MGKHMSRSKKLERVQAVAGLTLPLLQVRGDTTYTLPTVCGSPSTCLVSTFKVRPDMIEFIRPSRATADEESPYWFQINRMASTVSMMCQAAQRYNVPLHADVNTISFYSHIGTEEIQGGFVVSRLHDSMGL